MTTTTTYTDEEYAAAEKQLSDALDLIGLEPAGVSLHQIEAVGIEAGSLAWRLHFAETSGQVFYYRYHGYFPYDQQAFNRAYVEDYAAAIKARF